MNGDKVIAFTEWVNLVERRGRTFAQRRPHPDCVMVVAVTDQNRLLFVEEYRPAVDSKVIELPVGMVGNIDVEPAFRAAYRELKEETGYQAGEMEVVGTLAVAPGITDEILHVCVARNLVRMSDGGGLREEGEEIRVHEIPLPQIHVWLEEQQKKGFVVASYVYAGLFLAGIFPLPTRDER